MVTQESAENYFTIPKGKVIGGAVFVALVAIGLFSNGNWIIGIIAVLIALGCIGFYSVNSIRCGH